MKVLFGRLFLAWVTTRIAPAWSHAATMLLLSLVVACGSPQEREAQHLERGIALYEEGEDAKAMVEFQNVLRLNPKNADAMYHVGLIHERNERMGQAYAAYQAAIGERPEFVAAQIRFGAVALAAGEVEAAERAADAIEKIEPSNLDGRAIRAAVMLRRGDHQRALNLARDVLKQAPEHENAAAVIVGVLRARGRQDEALAFLDEALERIPASESLLGLKLVLLQEGGDAAGVVTTFEELIELRPDDLDFRVAFAHYLESQDRLAEAIEVLRGVVERGIGTADALSTLVRMTYRHGGFAAAEAELRQRIEQDPEDHSLQLVLVDLYKQEGRIDGVEEILTQIVEEAPSTPAADDAGARLAELRLEAGDLEGAAALADQVLTRASAHPGANLIKGAVAVRRGDLDEAIRHTRVALREKPDSASALRLLAAAHLQKNQRDLASEALAAVVRLDPTDVASTTQLARLLVERGDLDGAMRVWDQVVERAVDPRPALKARAALAIRGGNWLAAIADIDRLENGLGEEAAAAMLSGELALARGRYDEGHNWFIEAAQLGAEHDQALLGAVRAYLGANDLDGALTYLRERLDEQPDDAMAYLLTGEVLARAGNTTEATQAYREAIRLQPEWLAPYRQLGSLLARGGDITGAAEVFEAGMRELPEDPSLAYDLGMARLAGQHYDEAIAAFRRVLELDPGNEAAINNYAALVADHRYQDAEELARALDVAERFRTSGNPYPLDTLGWLHYRAGNFPVAVNFLERAVTVGGGDLPEVQYHLGMALHQVGQKQRALEALDEALAAAPAEASWVGEARAIAARLRGEATGDETGERGTNG